MRDGRARELDVGRDVAPDALDLETAVRASDEAVRQQTEGVQAQPAVHRKWSIRRNMRIGRGKPDLFQGNLHARHRPAFEIDQPAVDR